MFCARAPVHWRWPVRAAVVLILFGFAAGSPGRGADVDGSPSPTFPVHIRVDAAKSQGELPPIWRFFGADEPNYAYLRHGRKLLAELGELRPSEVYFRAHNLLTSGNG